MSEDVNARLNELMGKLGQDVMSELLEAYSVAVSPSDAAHPAEDPLVGVIGFTASKLRGNLALLIPSEVVRATQRASDVMDWTGELTNQFLGRLKNKLMVYGVALEVSTPLVVAGLSLRLQEPSGAQTRRVDCSTPAGAVHALISVRVAEGFELFEKPAGGPIPAEGEILFF